MRTGDDRQRRLEPFSCLACGEVARAAGNPGAGIQHQHLAAGAHHRGERGLVQRPADRHRGHGGTGLGQTGRRVQTVATVVPGTGEHHDARLGQVDALVVEQAGRDLGHRARGHAHQRHAVIQQGAFQSAHRGGVIRRVKQCFAAIRILIRYHARPLSHPYRLDTTLLRPHRYRRTVRRRNAMPARRRPSVPVGTRRRTPCAECP